MPTIPTMRSPTAAMKLTDAEAQEIERQLNTAIHEIVFACQHVQQDDLDDASNALMTAQGTIEEVANLIVAKLP